MKRILLISDTHGTLDPGLKKHILQADEVWHAGDIGDNSVAAAIQQLKPLKAVYGNIDGPDVRAVYQEDLFFVCEGLRVLITHFGGYPGKYPARVKQLLLSHRPKLFICGHSHILKVTRDKEFDLLHLNPGACGVQGFHLVKTALVFMVSKGQVSDLSLIELGKRNALPL